MAIGNVDSCMSVLLNTRSWEQQAWNKTKKQDEEDKWGVSMERRKAGS